MKIEIKLKPEHEERLRAEAEMRGVSPEDYARELLSRELLPPNMLEQAATRSKKDKDDKKS